MQWLTKLWPRLRGQKEQSTMSVDEAILAVLQEQGELYGVPLRAEVSKKLGREIVIGRIYVATSRLEEQGKIVSWQGNATAERGWRAKRYFRLKS